MATEEPILSRLDRLDNIVRQLEEIRNESGGSPKSSCASTVSSGTLTTSEGQGARSSFDFSPKSLEKHCRPIDDVITETELKGSLIQRLQHVEERVLKLGLEITAEKKVDDDDDDDEPNSHETKTRRTKKKGGLKQFVKSVISGSKHKSKLAC